jgi:hypothetical protein
LSPVLVVRRVGPRFLGEVMLPRSCVLLVAALALSASSVQAQTCATVGPASDTSSPGTASFVTSTTVTSGCSDRFVQVEGYIVALNPQFCTGTTLSNGYSCFRETHNTNATITTGAVACGYWTGASYHRYKDGANGTLHDVYNSAELTTLNAGSCSYEDPGDPEADCNALGNGYYWDGDRCIPLNCPIVISFGGGRDYRFTSAADGVLFDINGDGILDQIGWTLPNVPTALLAIDLDGDGRITSGKELFGDATIPGIRNGFDALAYMTAAFNGGTLSGSVSSADAIFPRLLLWTDRNHNGISEPDELRPASDLISDLGLGYQKSDRTDSAGNSLRFRGWVHMRTLPGRNRVLNPAEDRARRRLIYDVFFDIM